MRLKERLRLLHERWLRVEQRVPNLDFGLILLLLAVGALLLYRLADPEGSLIFDETYYVQNARLIAGLAVTPEGLPEKWFTGGDANAEHPPLAKVIMAAGVYLFRDNGLGWRLPSVALGLLSLGLVYSLVRQFGGSRGEARLAATILAFDNLFFVHSRIATLDIYVTAFSLLGTCLYFGRRYEYAGLAFGLATLCKINGLFGVFTLGMYEVLRYYLPRSDQTTRHFPRKPLVLMTSIYAAFTFFGLGALDCYFTEFRTPTEHLHHIVRFASQLVRSEGIGPQGVESTPLQWWLNDKPIDYFAVTTSIEGNTANPVQFQGRMSHYVIAAAPFALTYCALQGWGGNRLALLVVCMFVCNYGPVLGTWISARRICYIYYMLPSLPAFAIGIAHGLGRFPLWTRWLFVAGVLYSYAFLFPFKE